MPTSTCRFCATSCCEHQGVRRAGAAGVGPVCSVACGRLDGFWEWKDSLPRDTAAGSLIVREAGGMVSEESQR